MAEIGRGVAQREVENKFTFGVPRGANVESSLGKLKVKAEIRPAPSARGGGMPLTHRQW